MSSDGPVVYKIDKFTPDGSVSVFASGGLRCPHGLAFDKNGNLYVASPCGNTIENLRRTVLVPNLQTQMMGWTNQSI